MLTYFAPGERAELAENVLQGNDLAVEQILYLIVHTVNEANIPRAYGYKTGSRPRTKQKSKTQGEIKGRRIEVYMSFASLLA